MPIRIPDQLPASDVLRNENIFVMSESRASTQEIRPLKVLLLNSMPKKIETETQFYASCPTPIAGRYRVAAHR